MSWRTCAEPGCPELTKASRCTTHATADRKRRQRSTDAQRPNARARGYDKDHERLFRLPVLMRDPICVECKQAPSLHADHWPIARAELVRAGLNPNDPRHGRGLCASCHASHTARSDGGYGNPHHSE